MPKIAFVLESGGFGGAQVHVRELIRRLDRRAYVPTLLLPHGNRSHPLFMNLREVAVESEELPRNGSAHGLGGLLRLARFLRRRDIAILHAHIPDPGLRRRWILPAARLAAIPVVISTEHSHAYHYVQRPGIRSALIRSVARASVALQDRVITVSHAQRRSFEDVLKIPPSKLITIHNGVDLSLFSPDNDGSKVRQEWGIDPSRPLVGMVTRFWGYERCEDFLIAAAAVSKAVPDVMFVIVGGEPSPEVPSAFLPERARRIQALAGDLRLGERVRFAGFRPDMPQVLAALDVLVLPALYKSFGLVLIEAMASGKPVVASAVGGIPEIVTPGETGVLVPPAAPAALAGGIVDLIHDRQRAHRMGRRGREIAEQRFTIDRQVEQTAALYDLLLGSRSHAGRGS